MSNQAKPAVSRRKFLTGAAAAAAGAATLGFPMIAKAQGPISMRWQSTWPSKDIFHEYALDFAKKVNDMTGGDLQDRGAARGRGRAGLRPARRGRPRARSTAATACSCTTTASRTRSRCGARARRSAWTPTCCSPGTSTAAARSCSTSSTPRSAPTWCRSPTARCRPSRSAGSRSRSPRSTTSRASSTARSASRSTCSPGMGAAVNALPGGEIVPAMDRGLLDAAEFNNATSDRLLGFADVSKVCMLQSYHQNAEQFEIMFNKTKYDALPAKMRAIIDNARRGGLAGHVVEGDRPLLEGLRRAADQGQGALLQDAGLDPADASSRPTTRRRRSARTTRCSRRSRNRRRRSPSAWCAGISTPTCSRAWRTTTTSASRGKPAGEEGLTPG